MSLSDVTRVELPPLLRLSGPVVAAEIGWMLMGIVDTLMVSGLGPSAIGGVGTGSTLFFAVGVFGMGLLYGLDTVVAQAHGAGDPSACRRWLWQGLWLGLFASIPLGLLGWLLARNVSAFGVHPGVRPILEGYLSIIILSMWPLLVYTAFRRYLQALGEVSVVMFALLSANLVNAFVNWVLIHGKLGMPALGTDGAAWATVLARTYMAGVLVLAALWFDWRRRVTVPLWSVRKLPVACDLVTLTKLGGPAAAQLGLEVGVFAIASALAARLTPASLAAHQIALNYAGFTFMVPLGVSSAGAVRVGHAIGRRDPAGAKHAGWTALALVAAFMGAAAIVFLTSSHWLIHLFTDDPEVLAIGASLLVIAAFFQVFDGLQVTATGVLRGLGDTRTPMLWNLAGHWLVALPLAWWLAFKAGWGVVGIWTGLSAGLIIVGIALVLFWRNISARLEMRPRVV